MAKGLRCEIPASAIHLCIDMQRLFAAEGPWPTPWMPRVLPIVERLVEARPERTVFTRFIPPNHPEQMPGQWRDYYERWRSATLAQLDPRLVGLLPTLERYAPPARVIDKMGYSALGASEMVELVSSESCVILSGAETDVCVLSTLLGLVDLGCRTIVAADAVCSSSDESHDNLLNFLKQRFSFQVEVADAEEIIDAWRH
ncbi:cysteine hydrolase [Xanthobacteraceae bacterium A53D]